MSMMHRMRLRVVLVGLFLLLEVRAQGPEIGFCGSYETSKNFNEDFISEMENSERSYSFLMSTGQTGGCKKLTLYSTNIYYYQTTDVSGNAQNVSATFETQAHSPSSPATIVLSGLPFAELGSLSGSVTLNVLQAERDRLVLLSCYNIGLIRFRMVTGMQIALLRASLPLGQLHVLVPAAHSRSASSLLLRAELSAADVPLADQLKKVPQSCPASA